jgi:hypothetical protein
VLWFHQEAGPGVSAELMVGGKGCIFLGQNDQVNSWWVDASFIWTPVL